MTLEQQFEQAKALHKYVILKAKLMDYYRTIEATTVTIPYFLNNSSPEELADRDLQYLLRNDKEKYHRLYEKAWYEIADKLQ